MKIGKMTPRTNNPKVRAKFVGPFGQPDGCNNLLEIVVNQAGDLCVSINWVDSSNQEHVQGIMLTSEQRKKLAELLTHYEPVLVEVEMSR